MDLSESLGSKEGLKDKQVLKHHQTVERPRKDPPGGWATV